MTGQAFLLDGRHNIAVMVSVSEKYRSAQSHQSWMSGAVSAAKNVHHWHFKEQLGHKIISYSNVLGIAHARYNISGAVINYHKASSKLQLAGAIYSWLGTEQCQRST